MMGALLLPDIISISVTFFIRYEGVGGGRGGWGGLLAGDHAGQGGLHPGAGRQVFQTFLRAGGGTEVSGHRDQRVLAAYTAVLVVTRETHQVSIRLLE